MKIQFILSKVFIVFSIVIYLEFTSAITSVHYNASRWFSSSKKKEYSFCSCCFVHYANLLRMNIRYNFILQQEAYTDNEFVMHSIVITISEFEKSFVWKSLYTEFHLNNSLQPLWLSVIGDAIKSSNN